MLLVLINTNPQQVIGVLARIKIFVTYIRMTYEEEEEEFEIPEDEIEEPEEEGEIDRVF